MLPLAALPPPALPSPEQAAEWFSSAEFDHILIREPWRRGFTSQSPEAAFSALASAAQSLLAPGGSLVLLCSPPLLGQRLSSLLRDECGGSPALAEKLHQAENAFFAQPDFWNWDAAGLAPAFESLGFKCKSHIIDQTEERLIGSKDLDAWFDRKKSRWGVFMGKNLDADDLLGVETAIRQRVQAGPLPWKWKSVLFFAKK